MPDAYAGRILWVDLSRRTIRHEPTQRYAEWIGGRGMGAYLISQMPTLFSDEPAEQPVVVATGPLVATGVPLGVRTALTMRNQLSGGMCYSNVGGDFGTRLKMAGFDAVVIEGHSPTPVHLVVRESGAELFPAEELWGLLLSDFRDAIFRKHGRDDLSYICIGPAGERRAAVSCLMVDHAHTTGWGGCGLIFGAKKLKGIVAIGDHPVSVFDADGLDRKCRQLVWRVNTSDVGATLVRGGTHASAGAGGFNGLVPTGVKNLQDEYLSPEENAPIREEAFRQWETGRAGCMDCIIRCLHRYRIPSETHGEICAEGMHANSVRGLGNNLLVNTPDDLLMMHKLCNEYGMNVDEVSAAAGFALECADAGILPREHPGSVRLEWGNGPSMVRLVRQIGEGTGLGLLLSLGVHEASRQIGPESRRHAVTIKNVGINEQGLRSHRAWALGIMVSTRGGGHLGGSAQTENRRVTSELGQRLFENPEAGIPGSYHGKGKLVAWSEKTKAVVDSLGLCYFIYGWYDLSFGNPAELAELLHLATGKAMTGDELHHLGLRIHTLERYLSYRLAGHTRNDDVLPDRFYDVPVGSGPYAGAHLDRDLVNRELDAYYAALGWDVARGLPGPAFLREMELGYLPGDERTRSPDEAAQSGGV